MTTEVCFEAAYFWLLLVWVQTEFLVMLTPSHMKYGRLWWMEDMPVKKMRMSPGASSL